MRTLPSPRTVMAFQRRVRAHYAAHKRSFPWRTTRDPYAIVVSEIMLQQTQTARVLHYYHAFLDRFPTFERLAKASLSDVLRVWQGLGYNRRAKNLWLLAQEVCIQHAARLPRSFEDLRALPGIGVYTAAAVQSFAFNIPSPMLETNIRTVFLCEFFPGVSSVADKDLLALVEHTMDRRNARTWFYALMDYGVHLKRLHPRAHTRSKHYKRQSRFEGSDRQLRGALLREVLTVRRVPLVSFAKRTKRPTEDVRRIATTLAAEGLVVIKGASVLISPAHRAPAAKEAQ